MNVDSWVKILFAAVTELSDQVVLKGAATGFEKWKLLVIASEKERELKNLLEIFKRKISAISMFKGERNKKGRSSVQWKNMAGIPSQPNDKQCSYFVMRYMRDIIHDTNLSFADKVG